MRLSYSGLNTYTTCPLKYKYQYVDRLSSDKSEAMVFGTLLHSVLQYYHGTTPVPSVDDVLHYYSTNWKSTVYDDKVIEQARFGEGLDILKRYCAEQDPASLLTIALEMNFQVELQMEGNEEPIFLRGIIDRVDKLPDGRLEIIDYKTGRTLPSQDMVDKDLQLSLYWMAIRDKWPKRDMTGTLVSLYFVKHGEKIQSRRVAEDLEQTKREIFDTVKRIKKEEFSPTPSALCHYCDYRSTCPMMRHQYRSEEALSENEASERVEEYIRLKDEEKVLKRQLKQLSSELLGYCEEHDFGRLFVPDNGKSVALSKRKTYGYDEKRLREILEKYDRWEDVLRLDARALKQVLDELPLEIRDEVEGLKEIKKETQNLVVKR